MQVHTIDVEDELRTWLRVAGTVVIAGVGNAIRRDDFIGVKVVRELQGKVSPSVHLIECETVPESFMDQIVEILPSHVLLVDAAVLGLVPGTAHLYDVEEVSDQPTISTHTLPLRVFCDYIHTLTGARIALLLIEPERVDFGEGLTASAQAAVGRIVKALLSILA